MKKILILISILLLSSCGSAPPPSYQIAIDPQWYSMNIKGKEQNITGFATDILKEISLNQKIHLELITRNWDNLTEGLKQKKYEAILSNLYPYVFNLKKYSFSDLFLATGPVLVVPISSSIHSLDQMGGKEIAIQAGSEGAALLAPHGDILTRTYESIPQALNALSKGEVDGAIVHILQAKAYCKDLYQGVLKMATKPLNAQGIRLLTVYDQNPLLLEHFNAGLKTLHHNGKYEKLLEKWSLN